MSSIKNGCITTGAAWNEEGNDSDFNTSTYKKLLKECSLRQLLDKEQEIVKSAQVLHSEMQTLVYENYDKFISATETITKMKRDFDDMQMEMESLTSNMNTITKLSQKINSSLQAKEGIGDLLNKHETLKKLKFLFKLPTMLKVHMQENNFHQAVKDYKDAEPILVQYASMDSFNEIRQDCSLIIKEIRDKLYQCFNSQICINELNILVKLLLQLEESFELVFPTFMKRVEENLGKSLNQTTEASEYQDVLEFIDDKNDGFLKDLCTIIKIYEESFANHPEKRMDFEGEWLKMVNLYVGDYCECLNARIDGEIGMGNSGLLVRAADKFCHQLQFNKIISSYVNTNSIMMEMTLKIGIKCCESHLNMLKEHLSETLSIIRVTFTSSKVNPLVSLSHHNNYPQITNKSNENVFSKFLIALTTNIMDKVKGSLQDLMAFLQPDLAFSQWKHYRHTFCLNCVHEHVIVNFLRHLISTMSLYTECNSTPMPLLFLLAKACITYSSSHIRTIVREERNYLFLFITILELTDKWFGTKEFVEEEEQEQLCEDAYKTGQRLLNRFVGTKGAYVAQMLRKSFESKDWMHGLEPRAVRAVMKRVVEELTVVDGQVGSLFEEGARVNRSSNSSRKTQPYTRKGFSYSSNWSSSPSASIAAMQKLFSDRIDVFTPVEFSKVCILTGIVKISLKTLLECVRLKTFSKYGLQQIQVDTHYLRLYLWRFVQDENIVNSLLDDILGSAMNRCLEPILMEPSVIEIICERG